MIDNIDKMEQAIKNMREQVIENSFYLGSIRTQNKTYEAVKQRLADARPHIQQEFLSLYDAMSSGVLADIVDSGEEVRRPL